MVSVKNLYFECGPCGCPNLRIRKSIDKNHRPNLNEGVKTQCEKYINFISFIYSVEYTVHGDSSV